MGKKAKSSATSAGDINDVSSVVKVLLTNAKTQISVLNKLVDLLDSKFNTREHTVFTPAVTTTTADTASIELEPHAADDEPESPSPLYGGTKFGLQVLREMSPNYYAREIEPKIQVEREAQIDTTKPTRPKSSTPVTRSIRSRMNDYHKDRVVCDDCGKRGSGSRSQSGITYYYCRNSHCKGKGSSPDRFIGWTQTILEPNTMDTGESLNAQSSSTRILE